VRSFCLHGRRGWLGTPETKEADVIGHPWVFNHVGLLVNGPPGTAGLPFI